MVAPRFVIFLSGGYGTGKSSVLDHIGDRLADAAVPFALFDVDWFHRAWPPGDDDPENVIVEAENIAGVWRNYRRSTERQPVVSGVVATPDDRERYERAFDLPVRPVLLTASPETTEARLRGRYSADRSGPLQWHLARHRELAVRLERTGPHEIAIPTDDLTPLAVALAVLDHFGVVDAQST